VHRKTFIWSLTGVTGLLGFMLTVQITSHPQRSSASSTYLDLRTEIQEQVQEHQTLTEQISKSLAQLSEYRASEGNQSDMERALKHDAAQVAEAAGMTPVTGPGITITIRDNPNLPYVDGFAGKFMEEGDQEISLIVNDLFANGAKAISINGQRLVTTSTIRYVPSLSRTKTLQVNGYPVLAPYVISAVGDVNLMKSVLDANAVVPLLNLWQEDCIIHTYPGPHGVTVPAYHGPLPGNFAKEVDTK
jgi:uncharacterized protein YlxW (UPF0749 family)